MCLSTAVDGCHACGLRAEHHARTSTCDLAPPADTGQAGLISEPAAWVSVPRAGSTVVRRRVSGRLNGGHRSRSGAWVVSKPPSLRRDAASPGTARAEVPGAPFAVILRCRRCARRLGSLAWRPVPPSVSRPRSAALPGLLWRRTAVCERQPVPRWWGPLRLGTSEAVARARQKEGEIPALWQRIAVSSCVGGAPGMGCRRLTTAGPRTVGAATGAVVGALGIRPQKVAMGPVVGARHRAGPLSRVRLRRPSSRAARSWPTAPCRR